MMMRKVEMYTVSACTVYVKGVITAGEPVSLAM